MSADELPPYEPWMRELIDAERELPALPPELEARLLTRLGAAMGGVPNAEPSSDDISGDPIIDGLAETVTAGASAGLKLSATLAGTLGLVAGAAIGALGHAALAPVKERVITKIEVREQRVFVDAPRDAGATSEAESELTADAGAERATPPRRVKRTPAVVTQDSRDLDLADENALVTRMQNALARGQASEALKAAREHERDYPQGRFAEEREALAIQALAQLGERAQARARAERFYRRYPSSLLTRLVRATVENP